MSDLGRHVPAGGSALSWFVDAGVATLVVVMFWVLPLATDSTGNLPAVIGLAATVVAAVLLRWRWPLVATLTALVATAAGWVVGASTDPMIAAAWCLYPLTLRGGRTRTAGPVAVVLVLCSGALAMTSAGSEIAQRAVIAVGAGSGLAAGACRGTTLGGHPQGCGAGG